MRDILSDARAVAAKLIAAKSNRTKQTQEDFQQLRVDVPQDYSCIDREKETSNFGYTVNPSPEKGNGKHKLYKRQTSKSSIDVRKVQEDEAFSKWQEIVNICKEVIYIYI